MSKSQQSFYLYPPSPKAAVSGTCVAILSVHVGVLWGLSFCYGLDVVSPLQGSTEGPLRLGPRALVFNVGSVGNGPRGRYIDSWKVVLR